MRASARREPSLAGRLLDSPTIIPHPQPFVKGFFKIFLKFFAVFFRTGSRFFDPERKCPTIISHSLAFVKRFFKSFFNFFCDMFRLAVPHKAAQCPVVSQLAYYSTFIPFCQHLFAKFFRFGSTSSIAQLSALRIV